MALNQTLQFGSEHNKRCRSLEIIDHFSTLINDIYDIAELDQSLRQQLQHAKINGAVNRPPQGGKFSSELLFIVH